MQISTHYSRDGVLDSLNSLIKKFYATISLWHRNYKTRHQLSQLPSHLYNDVGLSKEQAEREVSRPFWN